MTSSNHDHLNDASPSREKLDVYSKDHRFVVTDGDRYADGMTTGDSLLEAERRLTACDATRSAKEAERKSKQRKIKMAIIGVALGLLLTSMVLVAVTLSMSGHIDDMVRKKYDGVSTSHATTASPVATVVPTRNVTQSTIAAVSSTRQSLAGH